MPKHATPLGSIRIVKDPAGVPAPSRAGKPHKSIGGPACEFSSFASFPARHWTFDGYDPMRGGSRAGCAVVSAAVGGRLDLTRSRWAMTSTRSSTMVSGTRVLPLHASAESPWPRRSGAKQRKDDDSSSACQVGGETLASGRAQGKGKTSEIQAPKTRLSGGWEWSLILLAPYSRALVPLVGCDVMPRCSTLPRSTRAGSAAWLHRLGERGDRESSPAGGTPGRENHSRVAAGGSGPPRRSRERRCACRPERAPRRASTRYGRCPSWHCDDGVCTLHGAPARACPPRELVLGIPVRYGTVPGTGTR